MMRCASILLFVLLAALPAAAAHALQGGQSAPAPGPPQVVQETDLDRQTRALASQLRCVVCQGLSIQDSPSQLAQEMRGVVREQLEQGRTPAEVKQYFVEKYGEWVLLEPEPAGFNLIVYVLPVLMLLGGAAFVFVTARNMSRPPTPCVVAAGADESEEWKVESG